MLATASKGMGFIGLVRVLVIIAGPATGAAALWVPALAILSIVTMFWGTSRRSGVTTRSGCSPIPPLHMRVT